MNGLLLANVRAHARRYLATGIAVLISTAFILAFLGLGNGLDSLLTRTARDTYAGGAAEVSMTEDFSDTDEGGLERYTDEIASVEGVRAIAPSIIAPFMFAHEGKRTNGTVGTVKPEPFHNQEPTRGQAPRKADEILLDSSTATVLGVDVGDSIDASPGYSQGGPVTRLRVVGVYKVGSVSTGSPILTLEGVRAASAGQVTTISLLVAGAEESPSPAQQEALSSAIAARLGPDSHTRVVTKDAALAESLKQLQGGSNASQVMLLVFPLISVLVAAIVVATTFQVIMMQRRRELALLRTLGATRAQVRSLVLRETLIIGALASLLGVLLGALAGAGILAAVFNLPPGQAALAALSPLRVGGTWLLGVLMTLVAGVRPALAVARLSPIEALSPVVSSRERRRHRLLVPLSLALLAASAVGIALGLHERGTETGFLLAFLGGLVALVASMMLSIVVLPRLAHLLGRMGAGVTGTLARENTLRSAGRTASTGIAIAIGVTLITMMSVGASSVRATLEGEVDARRPFDFFISSSAGPLGEDALPRIAGVEGVAAALEVRGTGASVSGGALGEPSMMMLSGYPDLTPVVHSPVEGIEEGKARVSSEVASSGQTLEVCVESGGCVELVAVADERADPASVDVSAATLSSLAPDAPVRAVIAKLDEGADVSAVESALLNLNSQFLVTGSAPERAMYTKMIDAVLAVVVALLGVSVLVAFVGVTNTLGLSVAERTRENGLLRALGMTRRSTRRMLAAEAVFISLAGALIGTALGVGFGVIGSYALPLELATTIIEIPWGIIGLVIASSVLAALLASWAPGRRASRTAPVEALAAE